MTKISKNEFRFTKKLAEQGDANAQCGLGLMYLQGNGVSQDYAEAVKWYRKAAEQGNAKAQLKLALMYNLYEHHSGMDYAEAAKWTRKAAEQGDTTAQELLEKVEAKIAA